MQQEYQDPLQDFTCCVGTGMESHALHGYGVYYESADTAWVNLFVPSQAQFTLAGLSLRMETGFPDGESASLKVTLPSPKEFALAVRRPIWAGDAFTITVNGTAMPQPTLASMRVGGAGGRGGAPGNEGEVQRSSYVLIKRVWQSGDTIEIGIPKTVRLEPTSDNKAVAAIMWGPLVLAGDLGPRREGRAAVAPPPALAVGGRPATEWLLPTGRPGDFTANGGSVSLTPFYRTHRRRYSVYWDVV